MVRITENNYAQLTPVRNYLFKPDCNYLSNSYGLNSNLCSDATCRLVRFPGFECISAVLGRQNSKPPVVHFYFTTWSCPCLYNIQARSPEKSPRQQQQTKKGAKVRNVLSTAGKSMTSSETLSGTTSEKGGVPSRTEAGNALEASNALNYGAWGIPAVLSRGNSGNALRAFPGSFRNFFWKVPAVFRVCPQRTKGSNITQARISLLSSCQGASHDAL